MTLHHNKGSTTPAQDMRNVVVRDPISGIGASVGADGSLLSAEAPSTACSITSVGDETTSTSLLAANTSRKSARIVNDSTAILYVACTEAASATNFTLKLLPQEGGSINGFTGAIFGLWASDAGGSARISEFT